MGYRSIVRQSLHYFARPHVGIPRTPVEDPAAWRGEELARREDWRHRLSEEQIAELDAAIAAAEATGKGLEQLEREDFPLPGLGAQIRDWAEELQRGLGVVVIRGVPVERWGERRSSLFFWCLGLHLGVPGAQNRFGELLGHVRSEGLSYDDPSVRGYRTAAALAHHCDAADVVGLLCLRPAPGGGGRSRVVSSVRVYNELLRRRPDLVDGLFRPIPFDTRGDGGINFVPIIPCRYDRGRLRTFYHGDYYRTAERHPGARKLAARERELLDVFDEIATTPGMFIDMDFEAGDVQLLSNHSVMHGRTGWEEDGRSAEPRHLLRLWLSLGVQASVRGRAARWVEYLRLVGALARARVRDR